MFRRPNKIRSSQESEKNSNGGDFVFSKSNLFILMTSRVMFLAPLRFTFLGWKDNVSSWTIRVSSMLAFCGITVTTIAITVIVYCMITYYPHSIPMMLPLAVLKYEGLSVFSTLVNIATSLFGVVCAHQHMRCLIKVMIILEKSESKLTWFPKGPGESNAYNGYFLAVLMYWMLFVITDSTVQIIQSYETDIDFPVLCNFIYCLTWSVQYITVLMVVEYSKIIYSLNHRLVRVNDAFAVIHQRLSAPRWTYGGKGIVDVVEHAADDTDRFDKTKNVFTVFGKAGMVNGKIIRKADIYLKKPENSSAITTGLSDVIKDNTCSAVEARLLLGKASNVMEQTFGPALFVILIPMMINLILTCFNIIVSSHLKSPTELVLQILLGVGFVLLLFTLIESCHRVVKTASRTKMVVTKLLTSVPDFELRCTIKFCLRRLGEDPTEFTAIKVCDMNRALFAGIFTTVTSNLVILLQFTKQ